MTDACGYLHEAVANLPRFRQENLQEMPGNGIYFLFEVGEKAHGTARIVRVGTHTGQDNLRTRISEHFFRSNKDRSIFRKHIGRCLLAKAGDPFLAQWELDLTSRNAREMHAAEIDRKKLASVEADVTSYMRENFSFAALRFDSKTDRLRNEGLLLSTICRCRECGSSKDWLGRFHPTAQSIRASGLWNVQGLNGAPLSLADARELVGAGTNY